MLSWDGVAGARGYCHVVLKPADSCGETSSAEVSGERRTVRLLSYSPCAYAHSERKRQKSER